MGYIIWAVIIISVLRAIFSSDPKKKAKNQRARDRAAAESGAGGRPSLDEVTRRKREQLQDLARQQRGTRASAGGGSNSGGGVDPGNMTMAERIARARAKQQYEQRASSGGPGGPASAQQGLPSPRRTTPSARDASGANAPQQRAETLRKQLEARRAQQRQAPSRRQQQTPPAQAQRSTPRPQPGNVTPRRPASGGPPVPRRAPADQLRVQRTVGNLQETPPMEIGSSRRQSETRKARRSAAGLNFAKLSKADLRRAFILKEVLDRPVSERDPLADVNAS